MRNILSRARSLLPAGKPADSTFSTADLEAESVEIFEKVRPYTLTSLLRTHALISAVEYVVSREIRGALVECGVWRGGAVLAMLLKLLRMGATHYDVFLYDTFAGMTPPGAEDTSRFNPPAAKTWVDATARGRRPWDFCLTPDLLNLDAVRKTVLSAGYPASRIHFVKGPVEQTLPRDAPSEIALLRLDTDWYASTWHELVHLYPRLTQGGVLIVDDYGHWEGCRRAVDQYFSTEAAPILLNRIDYTGRIGVKG